VRRKDWDLIPEPLIERSKYVTPFLTRLPCHARSLNAGHELTIGKKLPQEIGEVGSELILHR
jgi:hypothetical protein